jgi:hypothetical protein
LGEQRKIYFDGYYLGKPLPNHWAKSITQVRFDSIHMMMANFSECEAKFPKCANLGIKHMMPNSISNAPLPYSHNMAPEQSSSNGPDNVDAIPSRN